MKVCFSLMEYTAYGNLDAPNWSKMMSTENGWVFLKLVGMAVIIFFGLMKLAEFSAVLTIAVSLFLFVAYPAMNMILCMDKSMWSALNPARIIYVMTSVGGSYWILFGLMILFSLTSSFGSDFLAAQLSPKIGLPLALFFTLYVSFSMYHMFGYVIYQYHHELDFSVHRHTIHENIRTHGKHTSELAENKKIPDNKSGGVTEAEIFVQEGRYEDAERMLRECIQHDADDFRAYELLYRLFALKGEYALMGKLCDKHLERLMAHRSANHVRMAYLEVIKTVPEYIPQDPAICHQMIKILNRKDELKVSLKLLNHLRKEYIDYPGLADACFVFGKYLVEKANRREDAAKIIKWGINLAKGELKVAMNNYLKLLF